MPILREQTGLRIVTNAGGLEPARLRPAMREICSSESGAWRDRPIGVVTGDDVLAKIPGWIREGVDLDHIETGEPIATVADRLVSANVYLGARTDRRGAPRRRVGSCSPAGWPTPR